MRNVYTLVLWVEVSAYNGDLTESVMPGKLTNGVIGITGNYELRDQVMIRAGLSYTVLGS